jgi:hypothetical protein
VDRRDGAILCVSEKNWNAVRGLHSEEQMGTIRGGGISATWGGRSSVKEMNDVGVNLAESAECQVVCAESGLKAAAVLDNIFLGIPFRETEIEDLFASKIAHAAGARAESVHQPRDLGQGGCLNNSQIPGSNFGPFLRGRKALGLLLAAEGFRL